MIELIQIADDQGTPTSIVRLIAKGDTNLIPLFTYLIAESPPDTFFLQVSAANRNLSRFSPHPLDTITLAQMLSLLEDKGYEKDAIVANITYYEAKIEALINSSAVETPYVRPTTGSTDSPVPRRLPTPYPFQKQTTTSLGSALWHVAERLRWQST